MRAITQPGDQISILVSHISIPVFHISIPVFKHPVGRSSGGQTPQGNTGGVLYRPFHVAVVVN